MRQAFIEYGDKIFRWHAPPESARFPVILVTLSVIAGIVIGLLIR